MAAPPTTASAATSAPTVAGDGTVFLSPDPSVATVSTPALVFNAAAVSHVEARTLVWDADVARTLQWAATTDDTLAWDDDHTDTLDL